MSTMPTRATAHSQKKRWTWGRTLLVVLAVLAAVLLAGVIALVVFGKNVADTFDQNKTVVEAFPEESERPAAADDGSQTILLLGSDTRAEIDPDDINAAQDSRSDTIMVVRIPADREAAYVMSIMRDSWVEIPGYGEAKINAAMAYGGVPLTVQVVEGLIGSRIDRVAMVDFEGFKGLTDALGGVTVNNPSAFSSGDYSFDAGNIHLNGSEALMFVRTRKAFAEGDYRRVQNQQAYLKAVVSTILSRGTLTDPGKIKGVVEEISPFLTVDEGFDSGYLIKLLPSLRNLRSSDIVFFTAPTAGVGTSADGQSIILLDWDRMAELKKAFETDTLAEYVATQDLNAY